MDEKHYLHDLISSDRRYPDRERERPAVRIARVQLRPDADPRPGQEHGDDVPGAGAGSEMPLSLGPGHAAALDAAAAVAVLGHRAHLGYAREQPQLDVRPRGPAVARRDGARAGESGVLQGGIGSSVGEGVPDRARRAAPRGVRSEDEEVHVRRHLLLARTIRSSATTRTTRSGRAAAARWSAGSTRRCSADRRCGEVAGMDGADPRHERQRQARRVRRARPAGRSDEGHAHRRAVLRRDAEPGRRIDLGRDAGHSRRGRAARAGLESAGDRAGRGLQRAAARLRRARRGHRQQRRRLGLARSGHIGQLRSAQVQRTAQRTESDRRPLPRRLVVPSVSRARASRASARTAPSRATTRGSISTTRSASATTCRCRPAI